MIDLLHTPRLSRRQDQPGHRTRQSIRDLGYEQRPRQRRSLSHGGLSRQNPVARHPTREHEPDHASRNRQARRPLSRPTAANQQRPNGQLLTATSPYEPKPTRWPSSMRADHPLRSSEDLGWVSRGAAMPGRPRPRALEEPLQAVLATPAAACAPVARRASCPRLRWQTRASRASPRVLDKPSLRVRCCRSGQGRARARRRPSCLGSPR